ncbi:peptidyl-dipeptidase Dcp [Nakamurella panacisegetis]|uniref:Peptidyl-dipeptidase Dcp n=1 Tax=Nakamurella panacisegetis TaxID=1090615 RepID=A0A1H0JR82_9ACTN|nr:M3 family metallopeptidase [Nakamurella panacisegetis]SDO46039.1 peptidyl-dipeptidase Dcp [Nakamurella panacisegetis]
MTDFPLTANPLAEPSTLPFGLPPFADVRAEHFAPAFEAGMAQQLAEIEAIVADDQPPTFENTLVALERSGRLLSRAAYLFFNLVSSASTPEIREVETEFAPRLAAHSDRIRLNPELFTRIDAVVAAGEPLSGQEQALLDRYHLDFVLAGARLSTEGHAELRDLNERISRLSTRFQQNLQAATEAASLVLTDLAELDGLSEAEIAGAAAEATERGHEGSYLIPLILPSGQPLMSTLRNRDVRRRLFQASVNRASSGEFDNSPVAVEISALRARRAALLGFATHADAMVADQTAKTSAAVDEMLTALVAPALAQARAEAEILTAEAAADGVELAAWDWQFYAERVRAQRYSVDTAALRPYFALEKVLHDGVFFAAGAVYGVTFTPRPDLIGYHPDVRVWEVRNADGGAIGLYLGDFFAREGKRGGAWMNSFVEQAALLDAQPVVVNNLNVTRPAKGAPALLTLDEVDTLFHEFGHALHGLFSDVVYPRLSGTSVPRDFVEYPSQVNEMWARWPEVLANYAVHVETGEVLPASVVESLEAAKLWGEGFGNVEYLAATMLDQAWHRIGADEVITDAVGFEAAALEKAGLAMDLIPPRYRTTYFQHIFAGGYSAGYYSYIWSEVLDADTVEWFRENGGMTRANGDIFRARLLSVGGSVDALAAFRAVRGRDAELEPLLRRRGLMPVGG